MPGEVDVPALYDALDERRRESGLSWRQLARELELSPSTFTRLGNGHRPDVRAFAALTGWLSQPADAFIRRSTAGGGKQPALMAELAPLLRARKDLTEEDAQHLTVLFESAIKQVRDARSRGE